MYCGVACLSMICAYYGMTNMSLAVIRNFAQTDRDGNSIYSLRIAAEKLHLDSEAYEAEKEDLINHEIQLPALYILLLMVYIYIIWCFLKQIKRTLY